MTDYSTLFSRMPIIQSAGKSRNSSPATGTCPACGGLFCFLVAPSRSAFAAESAQLEMELPWKAVSNVQLIKNLESATKNRSWQLHSFPRRLRSRTTNH